MHLRNVSGREALRAFERLGFDLDHQTGSHAILYRQHPRGRVSLPLHPIIKVGTLVGILRAAKVAREEFLQALD